MKKEEVLYQAAFYAATALMDEINAVNPSADTRNFVGERNNYVVIYDNKDGSYSRGIGRGAYLKRLDKERLTWWQARQELIEEIKRLLTSEVKK